MPVESYELDFRRLETIKGLEIDLRHALDTGEQFTREQIFKKLFIDRNHPNEPVINEFENRQDLIMAIAGLDKEAYFVSEKLIYKKNVNTQS